MPNADKGRERSNAGNCFADVVHGRPIYEEDTNFCSVIRYGQHTYLKHTYLCMNDKVLCEQYTVIENLSIHDILLFVLYV